MADHSIKYSRNSDGQWIATCGLHVTTSIPISDEIPGARGMAHGDVLRACDRALRGRRTAGEELLNAVIVMSNPELEQWMAANPVQAKRLLVAYRVCVAREELGY